MFWHKKGRTECFLILTFKMLYKASQNGCLIEKSYASIETTLKK
ncbi:MAG: hypothetical protein OFPI_27990 [Osedax symbiont Rs2]|nr:MAG: hypothetical protein OFPI_27990 [Osedax symbiont Rs2]